MKQRQIIQVLLVMLTIGIYSCKKQISNVASDQISNKSTENQSGSVFMKFDNRAELDATLNEIKDFEVEALDQWSAQQNFVNARVYFRNNSAEVNKNDAVESDILYTIMNKDGLIQIGDYVYMHDLNSGLIWTISREKFGVYGENFIGKNYLPQVMNKFNLEEEDIIERTETGVVGISQNKLRGQVTGIFGIDNKPPAITYSDGNGNSFTFDWKASYQNLGIVKSLFAKLRHYPGAANGVTFNMTGITWGNATPFNKPISVGFLSPAVISKIKFKPNKQSTITLSQNNFPSPIFSGMMSITPFSGTRRLDIIDLDVTWSATDVNGDNQTCSVTIAK